jgi:hypothetical protein
MYVLCHATYNINADVGKVISGVVALFPPVVSKILATEQLVSNKITNYYYYYMI